MGRTIPRFPVPKFHLIIHKNHECELCGKIENCQEHSWNNEIIIICYGCKSDLCI